MMVIMSLIIVYGVLEKKIITIENEGKPMESFELITLQNQYQKLLELFVKVEDHFKPKEEPYQSTEINKLCEAFSKAHSTVSHGANLAHKEKVQQSQNEQERKNSLNQPPDINFLAAE